MSETMQGVGLSKIKVALLYLERLNIPFRGPFETARGNRIVLVENYILTQAELIRLHESDRLDAENIRTLIRKHHTDSGDVSLES